MAYTTKQQQAILACLQQGGEEPLSAGEVAARLRQSGHPVGLATVYRQLEKLEAAGMVHKVNTGEGAWFQYCSHRAERGSPECLLLQCEGCGRLLHLDCSQLRPLYEHLLQAHHFAVNQRRTVFTGLCEACRKEAGHGRP